MEFIALLVYIIMQIIFIPLSIIGIIIASFKQLYVSKKLGVSSTAISMIGNRYIMDVFGLRKDSAAVKFVNSEDLKLGDFKFMWQKTKKGAIGVIAEIII